MIKTLLTFGTIGGVEALVVLIGFAIPIVLAILFFIMLLRNKNENIRLRLEVGKLADELEQMRKQKNVEKGDSSAGSG